MTLRNTTTEQDKEITAAEQMDHIQNLIAIIEDLDERLSEVIDERDELLERVNEN